MTRRRSPQEKKRLSYAKDRRNRYGENDKSSRKNIPRAKRRRLRAERHRTHQALAVAVGAIDDRGGTLAEDRLARAPQGTHWRKAPDTPLGMQVAAALDRRVRLGISAPATAQARIAKVRQAAALSPKPATWLRDR